MMGAERWHEALRFGPDESTPDASGPTSSAFVALYEAAFGDGPPPLEAAVADVGAQLGEALTLTRLNATESARSSARDGARDGVDVVFACVDDCEGAIRYVADRAAKGCRTVSHFREALSVSLSALSCPYSGFTSSYSVGIPSVIISLQGLVR